MLYLKVFWNFANALSAFRSFFLAINPLHIVCMIVAALANLCLKSKSTEISTINSFGVGSLT
jgi:hypothetical protein